MIIRNLLLSLLSISVFNADAMKQKPNLFTLVNVQQCSANNKTARLALEKKVHNLFSNVVEEACATLTFEKLMKFLPLMESLNNIVNPIILRLDQSQNKNITSVPQDFLVCMNKSGQLKLDDVNEIHKKFKNLRKDLTILLKNNCFTDNERYLFEHCFTNCDFFRLQRIYAPLIKKFTRDMNRDDKTTIVNFLSDNQEIFVNRLTLLFFPLFVAFPNLYIQYNLTNVLDIKMVEDHECIIDVVSSIEDIALLPCIIDCMSVNLNKRKLKLSERYWLIELASKPGTDKQIRELLARGFYPDFVDQEGNYALESAIRVGSLENVMALIDGGASLDIEDEDGFTALDIARDLKEEHPNSLRIYQLIKMLKQLPNNLQNRPTEIYDWMDIL